jgi:galactose mutarotase-like enzyme
MAIINLISNQLSVKIDSKGAELLSISDNQDGFEYLWQADEQFWNRHAPNLFPIVGKLKDDQFIYQNKRYQLTQHGFARDSEFQVLEANEQRAVFELTYNLNSLSVYPFKFKLTIIYQLTYNRLGVSYQVENLDDEKVMYFSVGAHPGFNVPNFEMATITLSPSEHRTFIPVTRDVLLKLINQQTSTQEQLPVTRELFKNGVLIYETPDPTTVTLDLLDVKRRIKISYDSMKQLGIWSPYPAEAPFVCIEPWCGLADDEFATGYFARKYGNNELAPRAIFETSYAIEVS